MLSYRIILAYIHFIVILYTQQGEYRRFFLRHPIHLRQRRPRFTRTNTILRYLTGHWTKIKGHISAR